MKNYQKSSKISEIGAKLTILERNFGFCEHEIAKIEPKQKFWRRKTIFDLKIKIEFFLDRQDELLDADFGA